MSKKLKNISLFEKSGSVYQDLLEAQKQGLTATAADIATCLRTLLDTGILIYQNGKIIPNPQG